MINLQNIVKRYDQNTVVNNLSLDIQQGEFITLLGPSGCGKTTTLRMIAGFEHPTSGRIVLDGEPINDAPPYERSVNTVFQSYALFPHLNAFDNVAFGLRVKKVSRSEVARRVTQALKMVQLDSFAKRKPDQLSGGQKQRVAIARALVNNPKVLLLDEPLGALDQKLRKQMQVELKHLQKQLGITFLFVTHDQEEALTMSDRIAVMNQGVLEQVGTPNDVYENPESPFVAEFIGETNMIPGVVKERRGPMVTLDYQGLRISGVAKREVSEQEDILLAIRPERSRLSLQPAEDSQSVNIPARFTERIYIGSTTRTVVTLPDGTLFTAMETADRISPMASGDELFVSWKPEHAVVLKR
ncbi:spermidine/putrescine ABC transporter ATP-binding protein [Cohnella kolymensis]|uniref:Spermidine/putrescine import ATP-binding protein PotA n=1 Tax=Cohnella kolymensis TaxID=1590652 RepID=A0ABR5A8X5_9BACL|nr:ABC transporter ATP-binding protein [Cohnella kolymensis]KIL37283.1 spermidine/putrescine ABC transporter ATP-binding protein [Cohnella kolymensis]